MAEPNKLTAEWTAMRVLQLFLKWAATTLLAVVIVLTIPFAWTWLRGGDWKWHPVWLSSALAFFALAWWAARSLAAQLVRPVNIEFPEPPMLDWSQGKVEQSLDALWKHCIARGKDAIKWYSVAKSSDRKSARAVRLGAIVLIAVGGVVPILSEVFTKGAADDTARGISPGYSAIAFAIAGMLVILDRFFGYSSSWMRYVLTEAKIQTLLESFAVAWQLERSSWDAAGPTVDQRKQLVERADRFLAELRGVIETETAIWAEEFKSALNEIDKKVKEDTDAFRKEMREKLDELQKKTEAARLESRNGAITVEVENGEKYSMGWMLEIDDVSPETKKGNKTVAIATPGLHKIAVEGTTSSNISRDEAAVEVKSGANVTIHLVLTMPTTP